MIGTPCNVTELSLQLIGIAKSNHAGKLSEMEDTINDYIKNRLQISYLFFSAAEAEPILEHVTKLLTLKGIRK